jgi:hypothetical protein
MGGFWKKLFGTEQSPEVIAEERIQAAHRSGALKLDLSKLELRQLPPSIGQLAQLQRLNVWGNQLTSRVRVRSCINVFLHPFLSPRSLFLAGESPH